MRVGRRTGQLAAGAAAVAASMALPAGAAHAASTTESGKSATQILADAKAAFAKQSSVRFYGAEGSGTNRVVLNVFLTAKNGSKGSLELSGGNAQFVAIGKAFYLRGSLLHKEAPSLSATQWFKVPASTLGSHGSSFTSLKAVAKDAFTPTGTLSPTVGHTTVGGQAAVVLTDTADNSKLYISDATALPLSETEKTGTVHLVGYGASYSVAAPANAVTLPQS